MNDIRNRARHCKLWYDQRQADRAALTVPAGVREAAILHDLWTILRGDDRPADVKAQEWIASGQRAAPRRWARELGLDPAEPLLTALAHWLVQIDPAEASPQLVARAGHTARWVQHEQVQSLLEQAEIMLLERSLARSVMFGANEPLAAELLLRVPFPRTFVEFSSPVVIGGDQFRAAAFIADETRAAWTAALIYDQPGPRLYSYTYGCAGLVETGADDRHSSGSRRREEDLRIALRNLWDFATCRNVTIERVPRSRHAVQRQVGHLQGAQSTVQREVFTLDVNRTIKVPEEVGAPQGHEWAYQVQVPGCFHRWVYCAACGGVHRRDLLGQPCRACGVQVGPRANITVERYWHAPHTRGPAGAPLKAVVRQMTR